MALWKQPLPKNQKAILKMEKPKAKIMSHLKMVLMQSHQARIRVLN
ncbi:MAG: hypothetical protein [Siphoviridae sp. cttb18]|nr:MAG: hypothetical protein [Siphoviridae sp. cttb18]